MQQSSRKDGLLGLGKIAKVARFFHVFEKIINFTFEKISAKNINQKSKKKYQFDNEVIELFEENNQLDISLYNHIITKYLVLKN